MAQDDKLSSVTTIVFVTNNQKQDWWEGSPLESRRELILEAFAETGKKFRLMTLGNFLHHIKAIPGNGDDQFTGPHFLCQLFISS